MDVFGAGIIAILVLIGIFWVCRELFCWYWKINKLVEQSNQQTSELVAIKNLLTQLVDQNKSRDTKQLVPVYNRQIKDAYDKLQHQFGGHVSKAGAKVELEKQGFSESEIKIFLDCL